MLNDEPSWEARNFSGQVGHIDSDFSFRPRRRGYNEASRLKAKNQLSHLRQRELRQRSSELVNAGVSVTVCGTKRGAL